MVVYREGEGAQVKEHVAVVRGEVDRQVKGEQVLTRVHSQCMTSEVFGSLKCDCREQLELALERVERASRGVVIYLRQEGRGIGLGDKIKAYALQAGGLDTVDANRALGHADDLRSYTSAAEILRDLKVSSIALMTNNPAKVIGLQAEGITIARRVPHVIAPHELNAAYLRTKEARMGHVVDGPELLDTPLER